MSFQILLTLFLYLFQLTLTNWRVAYNQLWNHLVNFYSQKAISLDCLIIKDVSLGL
jgi:hypothetical protein